MMVVKGAKEYSIAYKFKTMLVIKEAKEYNIVCMPFIQPVDVKVTGTLCHFPTMNYPTTKFIERYPTAEEQGGYKEETSRENTIMSMRKEIEEWKR